MLRTVSVHSYDNSAIVNGLSDAKSKVEAVGKKRASGSHFARMVPPYAD